VVVVVPALSEGEHGEERVVPRLVGRVVAPPPPEVCERVDAERGVSDGDRAHDESPDDPCESADRVAPERVRHEREGLVSVEET
jgi:hypothetical protein